MDPSSGICTIVGIEWRTNLLDLFCELWKVHAFIATRPITAAIDVWWADDGCLEPISVLDSRFLNESVCVTVQTASGPRGDLVNRINIRIDFWVEPAAVILGVFEIGQYAGAAEMDQEGLGVSAKEPSNYGFQGLLMV